MIFALSSGDKLHEMSNPVSGKNNKKQQQQQQQQQQQ